MTARPLGPDLDAARHEVATRGLTPAAVAALTEIVKGLPLESLTPVKTLLKRFFSDEPWTASDDDALADIVGAGTGSERVALDVDLSLTWGWEHDRFVLRVTVADDVDTTAPATAEPASDLGLTFEADVVPEVTPSPRTIRFATPQLHTGASRFYSSVEEADHDPRAARVFRDFASATNVLVGPDFVAVTIAHADEWEAVLAPMLLTIAEAFTGAAPPDAPSPAAPSASSGTEPAVAPRAPRRLEIAWTELGSLRADQPADLERVLAATRDPEPARRQVAAALLADATPSAAAEPWNRLLDDESRSVRRSVVDAVVDAINGPHAEALRPLLERALADADAWTRWKAVHGIAMLGVAPSRAAVAARATDPDFRVRLEAARALG